MNIILIGYRGTGKTAVGKKIAEALKKKFVETDKLIVKKEGMDIPSIVKKNGWDFFRKLEKEVVGKVSEKDNMVISTGGGVILDHENIENLKRNGKIIWLDAKPETIEYRMTNSNNKDRPPLKGKDAIEEIKEVLEERKEKYNKAADLTINTDNKTINEVAKEIISLINPSG